jgi:hypothetical protein
MQNSSIGLNLIENSNEKAAYNFDVITIIEPTKSGYLYAEVSVNFSNNGEILLTNNKYEITETDKTRIARRIGERLRADKVFFDKVNEFVK